MARCLLVQITKRTYEAGVTAGALVQRFGSKRALLLTLTERVADWTGEMFAGLRAASTSPLGALRGYADCLAQMGESPGGLAHHLAYLQIDLADPDFHKHVQRQARATRLEIRKLLDEARTAGELAPATDTVRLARTVEAIVGGSLLAWAFYREGAVKQWVQEDLESVLMPHLSRA
ncbi:MAG TPA: hypothetical protein VGA20_02755 [Gemmatimonadales bacterium]